MLTGAETLKVYEVAVPWFRISEGEITVRREGDRITVEKESVGSTAKGWVDLKREIASSHWPVDVLFNIGVTRDLMEVLKRVTYKSFREQDRVIELKLHYYSYCVKVKAPIEEILPLSTNYHCFLLKHLENPDTIAFTANVDKVTKIINLIEEHGAKRAVDEIVLAIALGGLEYLNMSNKLEVLKNKVDELLREAIEEGANRISVPFVFKIGNKYLITTWCSTKYLVVQGEKPRITKDTRSEIIGTLEFLREKPLNKELSERVELIDKMLS